MKIVAPTPHDVSDMRAFFDKTWEADVIFTDRFLIDTYPVDIPFGRVRKCWFDIEWNPEDGNDFTQCWAAIDSFTDEEVCFAWREDQPNYEMEYRDGYVLHIYCSEEALHEAVIQYIEDRDFDMLIAHAAMWADIPHMVRRFKNYHRLSPIGKVSKVRKGYDSYRYNEQPIKGRWVFDSACKGSDGSGFERVWMDSGNGQFPSRKLGDIGEHLELGSKNDVDFYNDWRENFNRLCDYCIQDVRLLKSIDEYLTATDFFIGMVKICGVSFSSTFNVGNFARGLISRHTDLKFPTRDKSRRRERGDLQGAEVMLPSPGRHKGVAILDYKGLYPSIILGNNLCYTTRREEPDAFTRQMANGTYWDQTKKGILPTVIEYLFEERQKLKDEGNKILEKAVKRVMASLYGLTVETLGHGMSDLAIGDTILSEGRRALSVMREHAFEMGYEVLYGHTDSCFVKCPLEKVDEVATVLTDIIQHETGNKALFAEPEAWMAHWFCGDVKNRYAGIISWPPEDANKLKVAGFEMKHSNTPKAIRDLQKAMLMQVGAGIGESDITALISGGVKRLRNGDIPIGELSYSTRISKHIENNPASIHDPKRHYPTTSGGYARAARYYNWHMEQGDPFKKSDSVNWTYVSDVPNGKPQTDVVGYRDVSELEGFTFNIEAIVEKLVRKKLHMVYDVMGWDLKRAIDKHQPKTYW
jgi:DNA polymerase elongation subunit (family B)